MIKTITLITSLTVFNASSASDLIFKSGFENTALVTGTVTGLSQTGLSLELKVNAQSQILNISDNGVFIFSIEVAVGDLWSVEIVSLPDDPQQQSCQGINTNGTMPTGGANSLEINCSETVWNWDQMNWDEGGWN